MRVLVLGAGGTGGYFGARLAAAGIDTTFLVRAARAARLRENGLELRSLLGDIKMPVAVIESSDISRNKWDLILLSCKAYDLVSAMDVIAPAVGEDSRILPLLNGMQHLELLDQRFGSRRVLGGLCHIGVRLSPAGTIEHLNRTQHFCFRGQAKLSNWILPKSRTGLERWSFCPGS